MTAQRPPHEGLDKGAESDPDRDKRTDMERFRELARSLINVPRDDFKREEDRHAIENAARKREKRVDDV